MNSANVVNVELENVSSALPVLFERDNAKLFYSQIEKGKPEIVSTREMKVPMEISPGGDFGAFDPDGGDLGRGDGSRYEKASIAVIYPKLALEWTAKAKWGNDSTRKGVVDTVKRLIAKSMNEFRIQVDASLMTDGTGTLGTVSAVSTASSVDTITLDTDGYGAKLVRKNQKINIYDSTLATNRTTNASKRITFHDLANKQIKTSATAGIVVGDKLVVDGLSATPPVWLQGVTYHHSSASTGTWLGFDRSTTPEIRANRVNAAGALALPFPRLALTKIGDRVDEDSMKSVKACMHPCQKNAYEELGQLVSVIQKSAKDESLNLYFGDNMQMAGAPVQTYYRWNKKRIDFPVMSTWKRAELHPVGFYDVDGRKMFEARGSSGGVATSTLMYIVAAFNTYVENPALCAYIDGLTIPTGW